MAKMGPMRKTLPAHLLDTLKQPYLRWSQRRCGHPIYDFLPTGECGHCGKADWERRP